jgi:hypothetical protein
LWVVVILSYFVCEGECERIAASGSTSGIYLVLWYSTCTVHVPGGNLQYTPLYMQSFGGTRNDVVSVNMDICR